MEKLDYVGMRLPNPRLLLAVALPGLALADTVKPIHFGPYVQNQVALHGNPAGYDHTLTNFFYRFRAGWIEPFTDANSGLFKDTYFETDGDINVSPFHSDLGTTFLLKPVRYLEFGLSYNRLIFHNSLVTFVAPGVDMIDLDNARPADIFALDGEPGGADIFTFQANFTLDMGPVQFYLRGTRSLWDIDVPGKDFAYEYSSDIVIKPRDRINSLLVQLAYNLRPYSRSRHFSFTGFILRDQYWITDRTNQEKHLLSAGFSGLRLGRNEGRQWRGLDFNLGYWLDHPQLQEEHWVRSVHLQMVWKWTFGLLNI
jgi:hypothetical protein